MRRRNFVKQSGISGLLFLSVGNKLVLLNNNSHDDKKCREVWENLCGNHIEEYEFRYITPREGIPKVLIYGDSISIQYMEELRNETENKADVFRIFCNGGSSNDFVKNMEKMCMTMFQPYLEDGWDFKWDLIQFNFGLHDLKYVAGKKLDLITGKQVTSIENYRKNLREVCEYLLNEYPETKLIFCTTTPVPKGSQGRKAGDAHLYNQAALDVLSDYPEIVINDLYAFTKPNFEQWVIRPGNVHFNQLGQEKQGKEVARVIMEELY